MYWKEEKGKKLMEDRKKVEADYISEAYVNLAGKRLEEDKEGWWCGGGGGEDEGQAVRSIKIDPFVSQGHSLAGGGGEGGEGAPKTCLRGSFTPPPLPAN